MSIKHRNLNIEKQLLKLKKKLNTEQIFTEIQK